MSLNVSAPRAPSVTLPVLLKQFWRDVYGKEVQSAATYSYLWMADQMGHVCAGLLLDFALTEIAYRIFGSKNSAGVLSQIIGFGVASIIVCWWEVSAYLADVRKATGPFSLDRKLLRRNAVVAALYMMLGAALGWAFHRPASCAVPASIALAVGGILLAPAWLRQKIIWQKASLPYLFRLADAKCVIRKPAVRALEEIIAAPPPPDVKPRQIIVAGAVGSGRTSLAAGIGTEFAFRAKTVRYLSLDRVIEFATRVGASTFGDDPGPGNIVYWPWMQAEILIIDDIGPIIEMGSSEGGYDRFEELLTGHLGILATEFGVRHTVWILGDLGKGARGAAELDRFAALIRRYCKGQQEALAILLGDRDDVAETAPRDLP